MMAPRRIELKADGDDRYHWESDQLGNSGYRRIDLEKTPRGWYINFFLFCDGQLESITSINLGQDELPSCLSRRNQRTLVEQLVSGLEESDELMNFVEAVAAERLCDGVSVQIGGREHVISPPISPADIGAFISAIIADRRIRDWLDSLPVLMRNLDSGTSFLISDLETANRMLMADFPPSEMEDADFIIEVSRAWHEIVKGFHLSRKPRFDYDTRTVSGVSPAYDFDGKPAAHDPQGSVRAVMMRLPAEDMMEEDFHHYLTIAIDRLKDEDTPSP